ncbi:MAG: hypothetical protein V4545_03840 [Pseudomonadota bacterium]
MTRQSILIWAALLITLWLSWDIYQQDKAHKNDTQMVLPTRVLSQQPVMHTANEPTLRLSARQSVQSQLDLFAVPKQAIQVSATKKIQPAFKAPPPMAPPLPFQYLGRINTGDSKGVLINLNNEVTPIQTGDILLGQYLVQAINESETGVQVQFLYQPLQKVQTLTASTTN